jgi:hypothetical protein
VSAAALLLLIGLQAPHPRENPRPPPRPPPVLAVEGLDNGDFSQRNDSAKDVHGLRPIPWWLSAKGMDQLVIDSTGRAALRTGPGEWAEQSVAAFSLLSSTFPTVRGRIRGRGRAVVTNGSGAAIVTSVPEGDPAQTRAFEIDFAKRREAGVEAMPRFTLRLEPASPGDEAEWSDLSFTVILPCSSEVDLRKTILSILKQVVAPWLDYALDDVGPRKTGLVCHQFDAVRGTVLSTSPGRFHPLWEQIASALEVEEVPEWRGAYERFLGDWLDLCLDPDTSLPRLWDCEKDEPIVDQPAGDLALPLGFLIDVGERGPERFRARARAAVANIAETVLAKGVLPDGTIGASYYPKDGRANASVLELRRFDLLAQLARIPSVRKDPRFRRASEELRSAFEFDHMWWGTWERIDPGFDDEFGNYGARAASIALSDADGPEGEAFKTIALDGWRHYAPIWNDALRLGGNVAADQVRCWNLLGDVVKLAPSEKESIGTLLHMAARSHFKGEQYGNGAWGDVTIFRFGPRTGLEVGDYPGAPQNLLNGLATIYTDELGNRTDEIRAMYQAVLSSSVKEYKRTYGFLLDRTEKQGDNSASGTLRMLLGLVKMLRRLS